MRSRVREVLRPIASLAAALLLLCGSIIEAEKARASPEQKRLHQLARARIEDLVFEKMKEQPGLSAEDLARHANALLQQHGFDYEFDSCKIAQANPKPQSVPDSDELKFYTYPLTQTDGHRINFQFIGEVPAVLCGECAFTIPLLSVTGRELLVVSEGRQYWIKRPPLFSFKKMDLMDNGLKKVLRTWEVPIDSVPVGISPDGTALYIELYNNWEDLPDKIVLEVSGADIQFRARDVLKMQKSEELEKLPLNAHNPDLAFKKFHSGNTSHIIRYVAPCT